MSHRGEVYEGRERVGNWSRVSQATPSPFVVEAQVKYNEDAERGWTTMGKNINDVCMPMRCIHHRIFVDQRSTLIGESSSHSVVVTTRRRYCITHNKKKAHLLLSPHYAMSSREEAASEHPNRNEDTETEEIQTGIIIGGSFLVFECHQL